MLDAYIVQVRRLRTRKATGALELGRFDQSSSLAEVIFQIFSMLRRYRTAGVLNRSYSVSNLKKDGDIVSGIFNIGEYGQTSSIIDTNDGSTKYVKKKHEAMPAPYYFMFILPKKSKNGLLCLQRHGVNGVKGIVDLLFQSYFRTNFPDYIVDIHNVTPAELMREYVSNGAIKEVTVQRHEIPADAATKFGGSNRTHDGIITCTVRPADKNFFQNSGLIAFIDGQKPIQEVFDFADFEYDTVKAKIDIGGKERMVDITKPTRFHATFDISRDVTEGEDGYPTIDSLEKVFLEISKSLTKRAGIIL